MIRKTVPLAFTLVFLLGLGLVSTARADRRTFMFKINQPVEVPDRVIDPGQYQLRFVDPDHKVVELTNRRGKELGFFQVIPTQLDHTPQSAKLLLSKSIPNSPERIREWTYPGDDNGYTLAYPGARHSTVTRAAAESGTRGQ